MELLENGLFQFGVLIEKSYQDENGDIIVEGEASTDEEDHQGENLDPRGFVLDYFQKSGWIKWEHKGPANGPATPTQFIGEPLEAQITPKGTFYLKARLYKSMTLSHQVKETMENLEKSGSTRQMGFSIEGQALERDPSDPRKVKKALIRNVVLTMNPVNGGTWAQLAKSLSTSDALGMELDPEFSVEKAMDTGAAAPLMPQSLEGNSPKDEDETVKALRVFSSYVKRALNKTLRKSLLETDPKSIAMGAYDHAVDGGLNHSEACEFAKSIVERRELLKSVLANAEQGGAALMKLSQMLGETMDELEKSLNPQEPEMDPAEKELDDLLKSIGAEEEEDTEGEGPEKEDEDKDPDDKEENNPNVVGDANDPDKGEKGGTTEKSLDNDLMKSLGDETLQAIEISDVLDDLVKSLDTITTGVTTRLQGFEENQETLLKSLGTIGKALLASTKREAEMLDLIKGLESQVVELGAKPIGRKGVTSQAEVQTVTRQGGTPQINNELTKSQQLDLLVGAYQEGKVPMTAVTAFEQGYPIHEQYARAAGILKG